MFVAQAEQELEDSRHKVETLSVGIDRQLEVIQQLNRQKEDLVGELDAQRLTVRKNEKKTACNVVVFNVFMFFVPHTHTYTHTQTHTD